MTAGSTTVTVTGPPPPETTSFVLSQSGALMTEAVGAEVMGRPINTRNKIKAVQFATQQSDPVQLIPDDSFKDLQLPYMVNDTFSDDFERSDRVLDGDNGWSGEGWEIIDGEAVLTADTGGVNSSLFTPSALIGHWEIDGRVAEPGAMAGNISTVIALGVRWNGDFDNAEGIGLGLYMVFAADGVTPLVQVAYCTGVGPVSGVHNVVFENLATQVAPGEEVNITFDLDEAGRVVLVVNDEEFTGTLPSAFMSELRVEQSALVSNSDPDGANIYVVSPILRYQGPSNEMVEHAGQSLVNYDWSVSQMWHKDGTANLIYMPDVQAVRVVRYINPPVILPGAENISLVSPVVQPPFHGRTLDLEAAALASIGRGGIESPAIDLAEEGAIHAVVRIRLDRDLTEPIYLQIVTGDYDRDLLVQTPLFGKAGQTIEDYVSYAIGTLTPPPGPITVYEQRSAIINRPIHHPTSTDEVLASDTVTPPPPIDDTTVRVRLVQLEHTEDTWVIDRLSLYAETIIWEFTVNGGLNWYPAYGIRNNAHGILTFPEPGTSLRWRARSTQPNTVISSIQVRPVYAGIHNARMEGVGRGPNLSDYDQHPPIGADPEFNTWTKPVPRSWYVTV